MSRIHDIGGMEGFGPVVAEPEDAPPFHSVWEMRVFALMRILMRQGAFRLDEIRDAIERMPPSAYLSATYYERWVHALEAMVTAKGLVDADELAGPEDGGIRR